MKRLAGMGALVLAALVTLFGTLAAGDAGSKGKNPDVFFRKLDVNMDGRLSKDEFLKIADKFRDKDKARQQLGQTYDKLDPSHQGLSREQFRTFVEARAKKREGVKNGEK